MKPPQVPLNFSIVVPTYNRPSQLRGCVSSLAELDYPKESYEVIVVDDGGGEPLDDLHREIEGHNNFTLIRKENGGPASARNAGAEAARGRWLAFTDDDCRPASDWLTKLEARFHELPDRMLGGRTINILESNSCAVASQLILEIVYEFYNPDASNARFFASNNMAVPAKLFAQINGFDLGFFAAASEDRELCDRWLHSGHRMAYAPEAIIHHAHDLTLRGFCRQHFNYGRGAFRYHQLRAERDSGRMRDEMGFHAQLPGRLRGPLSKMKFTRAAEVLTLLILWQLVNALGFFYEMWKFYPRT